MRIGNLYGGCFDLNKLDLEIKSLEEKLAKPNVWDNPQEAGKLSSDFSYLKNKKTKLTNWINKIRDVNEIFIFALKESEHSLLSDLEKEINQLVKEISSYKIEQLLSGRHGYPFFLYLFKRTWIKVKSKRPDNKFLTSARIILWISLSLDFLGFPFLQTGINVELIGSFKILLHNVQWFCFLQPIFPPFCL